MSRVIETYDDTMQENAEALAEHVVGHRIVSVGRETIKPARYYWGTAEALVLTLDNGKRVALRDTSDCCAYTELDTFLLHADKIDHIITGVGTSNEHQKWHIYADMGDVLELQVAWSEGNPYYYGYGFDIEVVELP